MQIAYTRSPSRGDTDLVLARLAARLTARGLRLAGTVQINTEQAGSGPCDMDVKVLPAGGSGIRTHDTVSGVPAFQASALDHSAIPPGART